MRITQFISSAYTFSSLIWSQGPKCTVVWFASYSEVKGELSDGSLCVCVAVEETQLPPGKGGSTAKQAVMASLD